MSVSGAPTSPKPPTITVSPDRTTLTASSGETAIAAVMLADAGSPGSACQDTVPDTGIADNRR